MLLDVVEYGVIDFARGMRTDTEMLKCLVFLLCADAAAKTSEYGCVYEDTSQE